MGAGKSTIGKKLATAMGYYFVDLDEHIERTKGRTITELFNSGEDYFRKIESDSLRTMNSLKQLIVSTGGGTPCHKDNLAWMNDNGFTIWLNADWDILMARLANAKKGVRPIFEKLDRTELRALFDARTSFYSGAQLTVTQSETEKNVLLKRIQDTFLKG